MIGVAGEPAVRRRRRNVGAMSRSRLAVIALVSLGATAVLCFAVSRGFNAFRLERHATSILGRPTHDFGPPFWGAGRPPSAELWGRLADVLATPVIAVVLVACLIFGAFKRVLWRVVTGIGFAALAFVINDDVVKPLVHQKFYGELSFPSGNVTIVCATALAMWIALYPVLGRWSRIITFMIGAGWTLVMSLAVVGAFWHTPLDVIGALLLSVGVVTAGAAVFEANKTTQAPPVGRQPVRVTAGV